MQYGACSSLYVLRVRGRWLQMMLAHVLVELIVRDEAHERDGASQQNAEGLDHGQLDPEAQIHAGDQVEQIEPSVRGPQPAIQIGLNFGVGVVQEAVADDEPNSERTQNHTGHPRHDPEPQQCTGEFLHIPNLVHVTYDATSTLNGGSAPARWQVMPATVIPKAAAAVTFSSSLNSVRPQPCRSQ